MDIVTLIISFLTTNWVAIVAGLWALEALLRIVAPLTPWKADDNLVTIFTALLNKYFPKK